MGRPRYIQADAHTTGIRMTYRIGIAILLLQMAACGGETPAPKAELEAQPAKAASELGDLAARYVTLELGMGLHDAAHVDAYFGPEMYRQQAEDAALDLESLHRQAEILVTALNSLMENDVDNSSAEVSRIRQLVGRLVALQARIRLEQGSALPFDDETKQLFGVIAPTYNAAHFSELLATIDALVPGEGALSDRVNDYRSQFKIPPEKLSAVHDAAIAECRRRTKARIELPDSETFTIEYVSGKPWGAYNWFQGNATSLIQINTDVPAYIDSAVNYGCHEGYPGHHTMHTLHEQRLVNEKGWIEYSVYPLWSPIALMSEGSGNYGISIAFPEDERIEFETEVLWPLAGLDPANAERYYDVLEVLRQLRYAGNEAARGYLNGDMTREQAEQWQIEYALRSPQEAARSLDFIETYRSYVINYNFGMDLVRQHVEEGTSSADERWAKFEKLLMNPELLKVQQ